MTHLFKYLLALIAGALLWSLIPKCEDQELPGIPVKNNKIQEEIKSRDSAKKEVQKTDSVRIIYLTKWRIKIKELRDTNGLAYNPCDTIVHLCDTLITVDSTEISQLKNIILKDSFIINDYQSLVKSDSIQIQALKKQVRKEKFWKKVFQVTTGAALIFGVVR